MNLKRAIYGVVVAALAACAPVNVGQPIAEQWRNMALDVAPAELGAAQVGRLRFRGGLALSADAPTGFGGLSDLEVLDDGRLVAVSDDGKWFTARIVLDPSGELIGLAEPRLALMRDEAGEPFADKDDGDAEDLAQLPDGRFAVSFEQTHTIRIYDFNRDGPFGAASAGPELSNVAQLPSNSSLEAMAASADGSLIVGAEDAGYVWRAPLDANSPAPIVANYALETGFSLTSFDRLPDGNYVGLERFYAPVVGSQARVTWVSAASLSGGGMVSVTQWALFSPPLALDNFEGVSAVRAPDGGLRLYIISDDNFSANQRTLLYAFDVVEGGS